MEYKELIKLFNINKNDVVFFCSDIIKLIIYYKSIKKEFSPNNFIDSIIDEIGKGGTLIFPTYNWGFCQGKAFDIKNSKSETGALSNTALGRKDFSRTKHPIYSFAVFGKHKNYLCNLENKRGFGKNSPFDFMYKNNAKIITVGTAIKEGLTIMHYFEEKAKVEYRFHKYFKSNYIDIRGNSSVKIYSMYVKYLKAKKPNYSAAFWKHLEKQNLLKRGLFKNIEYSIINIKGAGDIIHSDLLKDRKYYRA